LASKRYQLTCQKGAYHEVHEHLPVFRLTLMNWLISNSHTDHSQAMILWLKWNISFLRYTYETFHVFQQSTLTKQNKGNDPQNEIYIYSIQHSRIQTLQLVAICHIQSFSLLFNMKLHEVPSL